MPDDVSRAPYAPIPHSPIHRYWLVFGLPWPDPARPVAPAAYAVRLPQPVDESTMIAQVFAVAGVYAQNHPGQPVVWFSDLTRWLDGLGLDWTELNIDWPAAIEALPCDRLAGVLLGIDARTHLVLCDASRRGVTLVHPDGRHERVTEIERARLHQRMRELLDAAVEMPAPGEPGRDGR